MYKGPEWVPNDIYYPSFHLSSLGLLVSPFSLTTLPNHHVQYERIRVYLHVHPGTTPRPYLELRLKPSRLGHRRQCHVPDRTRTTAIRLTRPVVALRRDLRAEAREGEIIEEEGTRTKGEQVVGRVEHGSG